MTGIPEYVARQPLKSLYGQRNYQLPIIRLCKQPTSIYSIVVFVIIEIKEI